MISIIVNTIKTYPSGDESYSAIVIIIGCIYLLFMMWLLYIIGVTFKKSGVPKKYTYQVVSKTSSTNESKCTNCGNEMLSDDVFCNNCGTKLK